MHWSSCFVGLSFKEKGRGYDGVDCWGLVVLVYAARGIHLPRYDEAYASVREREEIAALMAADSSRWPWTEVEQGAEREYDVAMFRRAGIATHVGVVVGLGRMLHVVEGSLSRVDRYDRGRWAGKLIGLFRHE